VTRNEAGVVMFGIVKKIQSQLLKNKISSLYKKAVHFQGNGKIREYSQVMAEIAKIESEEPVAKKRT
jgi:hypothetical protein